MSTTFHFNTIDRPSSAEFKDRGSRFMAYAYPISNIADFKEKLAVLKKEHPRAVHHCFAYRLGLDGLNFRVNDDGEPSGSAGRPILGQLDSKELTNVLVVVVRYFGGTLLGVPGLINAYKTATAMAIEQVSVIQRPVTESYRLQFDYTLMNEVMRIVKQSGSEVYRQDMQLFCVMEIGIPKKDVEQILNRVKDLRSVEIEKIL